MDLAKPKTFAALEAIIELESFTQYEVWKKAGTSFGTAHNLVKFLQEKHVIVKAGKKYSVLTWPGLLGLFAAYRTFPKPVASYRLPPIHAYRPANPVTKNAMTELSQLSKGTTVINVYPQDIPFEPEIKKGACLTPFPRTLLDLYSSNYAYGTDNWIKKKAEQWQRE